MISLLCFSVSFLIRPVYTHPLLLGTEQVNACRVPRSQDGMSAFARAPASACRLPPQARAAPAQVPTAARGMTHNLRAVPFGCMLFADWTSGAAQDGARGNTWAQVAARGAQLCQRSRCSHQRSLCFVLMIVSVFCCCVFVWSFMCTSVSMSSFTDLFTAFA